MNAINEELNLDNYDKDESDEENNERKDCILMVFLIFYGFNSAWLKDSMCY